MSALGPVIDKIRIKRRTRYGKFDEEEPGWAVPARTFNDGADLEPSGLDSGRQELDSWGKELEDELCTPIAEGDGGGVELTMTPPTPTDGPAVREGWRV